MALLIGTTRTTVDPCDCDGGGHSGHLRYLDYYTRKNPRKYRRRGGPQTIQRVRFTFTLNGHKIPHFLGSWLCHRKICGKRVEYAIKEIRVPATPAPGPKGRKDE